MCIYWSFIGIAGRIVRSRTVRRLAGTNRYGAQLMDTITGTPWNPTPTVGFHTGPCTTNKTIDFLRRKITNKGDHFEVSLGNSYFENILQEATYKRQQQPSLQVPTAPHLQRNRMNSLTQKSTPIAVKAYDRKATMAFIHTTRHELCSKRTSAFFTTTNSP